MPREGKRQACCGPRGQMKTRGEILLWRAGHPKGGAALNIQRIGGWTKRIRRSEAGVHRSEKEQGKEEGGRSEPDRVLERAQSRVFTQINLQLNLHRRERHQRGIYRNDGNGKAL